MAAAPTSSRASLSGAEPPPLNLESPRVCAAMRVLGVVAGDLEPKSLAAHGGNEAKFELFERKRRNLVAQVANMAERGPAASRLLASETSSTAAYMEEVQRKEQEALDRLQQQAAKDVQNIVIQELATKSQMHKSQQKQEESVERMQRLKNEQKERMKLAQKEAAKKAEKANDVRGKCRRAEQERGEEITAKLLEADEKAANKLSEISQMHEEARAAMHEKRGQIAERMELREIGLAQQREGLYGAMLTSHDEKLGRLAMSLTERQQKAEVVREKQQRSMERVQERQQEKEAEIEGRYAKIVERHAETTARRQDLAMERLKVFRARNTKARNAHESRYERLLKDQNNNPNVSRRLSQSASEPVLRRSCLRDPEGYSSARFNHTELVASNRERLNRAQHHAVEQQVGKLAAMRARAQGIQDARATADQRRMGMLRSTAIEKSHLTHQVDQLRDAPPGKMLRVLEGLSPDRDSATKINQHLATLGLGSMGGEKAEDAAAERAA